MPAELHLVGFRVGQQSYALPIEAVREIVRPRSLGEITAVPQAPKHVAGVMNLRGRILTVIDLRTRFSVPAEHGVPSAPDSGAMGCTQQSTKNRVIVIAPEPSGEGKLVGLLVDAASEVLKIAAESVEPSPNLFGERQSGYVKGIAKHLGRLVILIDVNKLLPEADIAVAESSSPIPEPGAQSPGPVPKFRDGLRGSS